MRKGEPIEGRFSDNIADLERYRDLFLFCFFSDGGRGYG